MQEAVREEQTEAEAVEAALERALDSSNPNPSPNQHAPVGDAAARLAG